MKRRTRIVFGSLALGALTVSIAETAIASVCWPGMDMEMSEMVGAQAAADDYTVPTLHDHEHRNGSQEDERHCPFGPAVAAGCAVAALPSQVTSDLPAHLNDERAAFSEGSEHDPLLASALFHPPRA